MRSALLYQVMIIFFMTMMLMDAARLTTSQDPLHGDRLKENAKLMNEMISGNISVARFKATKALMMKDDDVYFHATLGTNKNRNVLPTDIGK
jgi:hypothetical protein